MVASSLDRRQVLILANPKAGPRLLRRPLDDLVSHLRFRGLQPSLCWDREALADHVKRQTARCAVS
jgi:hypothetical protein